MIAVLLPMSRSDRIAVVLNGEIVELDTPHNLYHRPRKAFTAQFVSQSELIPCEVQGPPDDGKLNVSTPLGPLVVAVYAEDVDSGQHCLVVRPEHIQLLPTDPSAGSANTFFGKVENRMFSGRLIDYRVAVGALSINVQALSNAQGAVGDAVMVHMPPEHCVVVAGWLGVA